MAVKSLIRKADLPEWMERTSHEVIRCAIEVHRVLGPGLLERIYEDALVYELNQAGLRVDRQVEVVIAYKDARIRGQRIDLLVSDSIIVELKSVERVLDVHRAQLLSYLRAAKRPLGLLFNFNTSLLRDGLHRILNERAIASCTSAPIPPSSPSRASR